MTHTTERANPVPLGLACFAISVFMLSGYLWGSLQAQTIVATSLFVGGAGLLLTAVAAYRRGDTLDATWMGAYSVFWASLAFYMWFFAGKTTSMNADMGWLAVAWGVFTAYMFVVSLRAKSALVSLQLILFFILFLFVWIGAAFNVASADRVAAIAGIVSAIVAAIESLVVVWAMTTKESPILTRVERPPSGTLPTVPHTA